MLRVEQKKRKSEYQKEYYQKNKKRLADYKKAWREKNKERILEKKRKYYDENKEEIKEKARQYRKINTEKIKEYRVTNKGRRRERWLTRYGLTQEKYQEMLDEQNYGCAICGNTNDEEKLLMVDHDHSTDKVRGLLCHRCNSGIGLLRDDVDLLFMAIDYLEERC